MSDKDRTTMPPCKDGKNHDWKAGIVYNEPPLPTAEKALNLTRTREHCPRCNAERIKFEWQEPREHTIFVPGPDLLLEEQKGDE